MVDYATQITRDTAVRLVLRMLRGLDIGGTPSETMEDEVQIALNMAIKAFDGCGWCRQLTATIGTLTMTADDWSKQMTTDVHSVQAAYFKYTGDWYGHDIKIVSPKECFSHGPIYAKGLPTHACITVPDVPATAGYMWFNKRVDYSGTVYYTYKKASTVLASDTDKFIQTGYPEEFLHVVALMAAIDLAPAFAVPVAEMQEMRAQLEMHLNMLKSGQMLQHPGSIPILTGQIPATPKIIGEQNQ